MLLIKHEINPCFFYVIRDKIICTTQKKIKISSTARSCIHVSLHNCFKIGDAIFETLQ